MKRKSIELPTYDVFKVSDYKLILTVEKAVKHTGKTVTIQVIYPAVGKSERVVYHETQLVSTSYYRYFLTRYDAVKYIEKHATHRLSRALEDVTYYTDLTNRARIKLAGDKPRTIRRIQR